ncbi:MAG: peptidylprolyl isomerase [Burkholderiaceae bacterium]
MSRRLAGVSLTCLVSTAVGWPGQALAQPAKPIEPVDRVIAVVNTEVVTERELATQVELVRERLRRRGRSVPSPESLEKRVLERIVLERAQDQAARERGITINESQVDRGIDQIARDNNMTLSRLRDQLRAEGIGFAAFRDDIRGQIVRARLREATVGSRIRASDADIDAWLAEQSGKEQQATQLQVAQLLLRLPENPGADEVQAKQTLAAELKEKLADGASFAVLVGQYSDAPNAAQTGGSLGWRNLDQLPQLFADAVSRLAVGDVSEVVRSPAGLHILKVLERRGGQSELDKPIPQTKVRHILIRPGASLSEDQIRRQMQSIRERLIAGTVDFAAMARQYSVDGSAANGGDLGWVYAGDTVPEFERAMDALAPEQVSEPVRTQFGFHLIEVLDRRQDSASPERRRQIARRALIAERTDSAWREWLDELRARTYVELRFEQ